jgi:hypothetical protein
MDILAPLAIILIAVILYYLTKSNAQGGVHRNFKLDPGRYKLVGSDLGERDSTVRLSFNGVNGAPDAVFEDRKKARIIVGEHKARKHRHGVRLREYYQIMLYIGMARRRWHSHEVVGLISFTDKVVWINFDESVFSALVGLKAEAIESIRSRRALNPKPLHKRINIRLPK